MNRRRGAKALFILGAAAALAVPALWAAGAVGEQMFLDQSLTQRDDRGDILNGVRDVALGEPGADASGDLEALDEQWADVQAASRAAEREYAWRHVAMDLRLPAAAAAVAAFSAGLILDSGRRRQEARTAEGEA